MAESVWGAWLRHAVSAFHLTPEGFWRLSLKEWLILNDRPREEGLKRAEFEALMQAFPDTEQTQ